MKSTAPMNSGKIHKLHPPQKWLYRLPDDLCERELVATLRAKLRVEVSEQTRSTTYVDTFDWRLFNKGMVLTVEVTSQGTWLRLHDSAGRIWRAEVREPPAFPNEIPDPTLADAIAPIVGMRRLLALATVKERGSGLAVLGAESKTVARLAVRRRSVHPGSTAGVSARDHDGGPAEIPWALELQAMRGYDDAARQVRSVVERMGLVADDTESDEVRTIFAAVGRTPGDYRAKLDLALDPKMTGGQALQTILARLLDVMVINEQGTIEDWDSEFLHDFRVAMRRTRTALGQLKGVLARETLAPFRSELQWLASLTGPVRDLDVLRVDFVRLREDPTLAIEEELTPFEALLQTRHRAARAALVKALRGKRYRNFVADWRAYIEAGYGCTGPAAEEPVFKLARGRIWRLYRRVRDAGRRVGPDSDDQALHDLRIECKKLRYLLEFFSSVYPPGAVSRLIAAQKRLQDTLGRFNDYAVQIAALTELAPDIVAPDVAAPKVGGTDDSAVSAVLSMGRIVERLSQRQYKQRLRFQAAFAAFDSKSNQARFRRLFRR